MPRRHYWVRVKQRKFQNGIMGLYHAMWNTASHVSGLSGVYGWCWKSEGNLWRVIQKRTEIAYTCSSPFRSEYNPSLPLTPPMPTPFSPAPPSLPPSQTHSLAPLPFLKCSKMASAMRVAANIYAPSSVLCSFNSSAAANNAIKLQTTNWRTCQSFSSVNSITSSRVKKQRITKAERAEAPRGPKSVWLPSLCLQLGATKGHQSP